MSRTGNMLATLGLVLLVTACEKKAEDSEPSTPVFWQELELSAESMTEYCEQQRAVFADEPPGLLDSLPAKAIKTPRWSGFLRYIPERGSRETIDEACFALVNIPNREVARSIDEFRDALELPDCESELKSPSSIACFIADGDPSGLAMWHARSVDGDLAVLGLATIGLAPGRTETLAPADWFRPKPRPTIDTTRGDIGGTTPRFEADDFGLTFGSSGTMFLSDLETPQTLKRFNTPVSDCASSASRCTIKWDVAAAERGAQLFDRMERYRRERKLRGSTDEGPARTKVAIDATADRTWGELRTMIGAAQSTFQDLLVVGDRTDSEGPLPTYAILPLSEEGSVGTQVEEVAEPIDMEVVAREIRITADAVTVQLGSETRTFAKTQDGYPWASVHEMLVELHPRTLIRPTVLLSPEDDVTWADVVKLAEVVVYRRAKASSRSTCDVILEGFDASVPCLEGPLYAVSFRG